MGYIYKITNKLNNKMYIGKTTETVATRWKKHCQRAETDFSRTEHFMLAIRKYGKENFLVECVEQVEDDKLAEREQYWIAYYDTFFGEGYNSTMGGEGALLYDRKLIKDLWESDLGCSQISERLNCSRRTISSVLQGMGISSEEIISRGNNIKTDKLKKEVEQYSLEGQLIKKYSSAIEAADELKIDCGNIRKACRGNVYANGSYWKFSENPASIEDLIKKYKDNYFLDNCRAVEEYTLDGEYLKTWRSLKDAAEACNCTKSNIYRACHNYLESACGSLWTYADSEEDMVQRSYDYNHKIDSRAMPIEQYTLEGNFIRSYPSIGKAALDLGVDKTAIHKGLQNHYTSYGFIWIKPGEEEWIEKIILRHKSKHDSKKKVVYQYDLEGNFITSYPSATDACLAMGLPTEKKRSLSRNCQGYQKTFNGYVWSYDSP